MHDITDMLAITMGGEQIMQLIEEWEAGTQSQTLQQQSIPASAL
ncbi:MAG: hypothetical protein U1F34_04265 [Gammaproteobacteria bacterium]